MGSGGSGSVVASWELSSWACSTWPNSSGQPWQMKPAVRRCLALEQDQVLAFPGEGTRQGPCSSLNGLLKKAGLAMGCQPKETTLFEIAMARLSISVLRVNTPRLTRVRRPAESSLS